MTQHRSRIHRSLRPVLLVLTAFALATPLLAEPQFTPQERAVALDQSIDWRRARLIGVQAMNRHKTLESFSREVMARITGQEQLPGLSPCASLLEWLFNRDAYLDAPIVYVRNAQIRAVLASALPNEQRFAAIESKYFSTADIASDPVAQALSELQRVSINLTAKHANNVIEARYYATLLPEEVKLVPPRSATSEDAWYTPIEALGALTDSQLAAMGLRRADLPRSAQQSNPDLDPDTAREVTLAWSVLRAAWLNGDVATAQRSLDQLAALLPTLAPAGVYPTESQRAAEARYYAMGKYTFGWSLYFVALLMSVFALLTGWRWAWVAALVMIAGAMGLHIYAQSLRWYILGRIPVGNLFEAITSSALIGVALMLVLELFLRTRVLPVACAALGFAGLMTGQFLPVISGGSIGGGLETLRGILDDIQLRIHTVTIISAYALCFAGAIIAVVYLIGYYAYRIGSSTPSAGGGLPGMSFVGAARQQRPLMAGALPGDDTGAEKLPQWLNNIDWAHLIILNLVFILLFVGGIILGAIWADYSWGRPWGWDAKEVFALNTWIIYAILIHVRYVVKRRGLWTAWLSIAGCGMMLFNWFYVNLFIQSIHSYA